MRKQSYTAIAMVVLLGCLAVSVKAQCGLVIAKIPFQFSAGKTTLPAGEYTLKCLAPTGGLLLIRSTDGKANAAVAVVSVKGASQDGGRLVFHRYGSHYFFVQAWAGGDSGLESPTTRAERAAGGEQAGMKPQREEIALALRH